MLRWVLLGGLLALVLAAAILWNPADDVDAAARIAEPALVADAADATVEAGVAAVAARDGGEAVATHKPDGGAAHEVSVELLEPEGDRHAAGAGLSFCRERTWGSSGRAYWDCNPFSVPSTLTDVMGFATVELVPGEYQLSPKTEPERVTIYANTRRLTLRLQKPPAPRIVTILVINPQGKPVPKAQIEIDNGPVLSAADAGAEVVRRLRKWRSSSSGETDAAGTWSIETDRADLIVRARAGDLESLWEHVGVPGRTTIRLLPGVARVRFRSPTLPSTPLFLEYDSLGDTRLATVPATREETALPSGHVVVRARPQQRAGRD